MSDILDDWITQDFDMENSIENTDQNIFEGEDMYGEDNEIIGHTDSFNGREEIYGEDYQHEGYSEENIFGGEDYYNEHNQLVAYTTENNMTGEETLYNDKNQMVDDIEDLNEDLLDFEGIGEMQSDWEAQMLSSNTFDGSMNNLTFPPLI
ncbi:MAG: hypothetical protein ACQEQF_06720 [Bacillota bacterium]